MRLTVLNEGLRASEASMNRRHVKGTLPVTALNDSKPFFTFNGLSSRLITEHYTQLNERVHRYNIDIWNVTLSERIR